MKKKPRTQSGGALGCSAWLGAECAIACRTIIVAFSLFIVFQEADRASLCAMADKPLVLFGKSNALSVGITPPQNNKA